MKPSRSWFPLLSAMMALLLCRSLAGGAVVQTCDENGLRAALAASGSVTFACDGTIVLASPIVVTTAISLDAVGHDVRLSGGGKVRLFEVSATGSVRLQGLTLRDGFYQGAEGYPAEEGRGGAVLVEGGQFRASDCVFEANTAVGGVGIGQIPLYPAA